MGEHRILAAHGGLITRQQALQAGVSQATISRRLRSREWFAVFPGVYRHCAATLDEELMTRAALTWAGHEAVLSGRTAAWWHGLCAAPMGDVTLTLPLWSAKRSRTGVDVRRRELDPREIRTVRGARVVSRALAALECAALVDGEDILDHALQRYVSTGELDSAMRRFSGGRGAKAARHELAKRMDGTVSEPERWLAKALRAAGLSQVKAGVRIRLDGTLIWLDFAVEELRLAIEIDGVLAHTTIDVFHRDRAKQNLLVTNRWCVLRYTPKQLNADMAAVVAEINRTIADLGG